MAVTTCTRKEREGAQSHSLDPRRETERPQFRLANGGRRCLRGSNGFALQPRVPEGRLHRWTSTLYGSFSAASRCSKIPLRLIPDKLREVIRAATVRERLTARNPVLASSCRVLTAPSRSRL